MLSLLQKALVEAEPEEDRVASAAKLAIFKLTPEEVAFKPVPLLPAMAELRADDLAEVPAARQHGPFNAFSPPQDGRPGQQWVVSALHCICLNKHSGCAPPACVCTIFCIPATGLRR